MSEKVRGIRLGHGGTLKDKLASVIHPVLEPGDHPVEGFWPVMLSRFSDLWTRREQRTPSGSAIVGQVDSVEEVEETPNAALVLERPYDPTGCEDCYQVEGHSPDCSVITSRWGIYAEDWKIVPLGVGLEMKA